MTLDDTILTSKEIRRLIVNRSFELGIPLRYVCYEAGLGYTPFMRGYINSTVKSQLDPNKILKVLELLGVDVKYQFIVNKEFNGPARKEYLKINYENRKKIGYEPEEEGSASEN